MEFCIAASSTFYEVSTWMTLEGITSLEQAKRFITEAAELVDPPDHLKTTLIGIRIKGVVRLASWRDAFGEWVDVEPVDRDFFGAVFGCEDVYE